MFSITGFDLIGGGNKTNAGTMFITLKPWDERPITSYDLIAYSAKNTAPMREGMAIAFNPPPIRGLGTAGGFEAYVQNRADSDPKKLAAVLQDFSAELRKRPELTGINSFFRPTVPQLFVEVDREKALVARRAAQRRLRRAAKHDGRALRQRLQQVRPHLPRADPGRAPPYRLKPEDLGAVYVRSSTSGEMLPLKSLITVRNIVGAEQLDRFNGFVAAKVLGNGAPGVSSGQAIAAVEEVAAKALPAGYSLEWAGQAFQERRVGRASIFAFGFALIMVFLILSAKYERWSLPVAVLLAVPFAVLGALVAVLLRGMSNDIYFQIGLVTLIGLAAKNAILIVEFAAQKQAEGMSSLDAAVEAARLRFRPIVMTSLAFVLGVVPLVVATGAGAGGAPLDGHRRVRRHARRDRSSPRCSSRCSSCCSRARKARPWNRAGAGPFAAHETARRACCVALPPARRLRRSVPITNGLRSNCRRATPMRRPGRRPARRCAPTGGRCTATQGSNELVATALARNSDIRLAVARIEEADANLREANASFLPEIDLNAVPTRSRISSTQATPLPGGIPPVRNDVRLAALDLVRARFLGQAAARRRGRARAGAGHALREGRRGALAGGPHGADLLLAALARRADRGHTADAGEPRAISGLHPPPRARRHRLRPRREPGRDRARRQRGAAQGPAAPARARRAPARHAHGTARPHGRPAATCSCCRCRRCRPRACPPALIERRPDIRQAEQALVSANAQIGVAKAAMLPTISLTGADGWESKALSSLLQGTSRIWSLGFALTLPIFDWGRYQARTDAAIAREHQAVAGYQKSIETGFREVADALTNAQQTTAAEDDYRARLEAARNALRLARLRYESGYSAYLEVLDAQRTANDAELAFVRNRQARLSASVDLMKALGGGWAPEMAGAYP